MRINDLYVTINRETVTGGYTERAVRRIRARFYPGQRLRMEVRDWAYRGDTYMLETVEVVGLYTHHMTIRRKGGFLESVRYTETPSLIKREKSSKMEKSGENKSI